MAVPIDEQEISQNDDVEKLALAQSYYILSESAAWKDLMGRIQALADQAEQELFSDTSPDKDSVILLKTRWQQRKLVQVAIRQIVQGQLDTRAAILEEMNKGENNEQYPDNAE